MNLIFPSTVTLIGISQDAPALAGSSGSATAPNGAPGEPAAAPGMADGANLFMLIIPLLVLMVVFSLFSQRREKKRRAQMLGGMKKHDKVRTIGGVIGAVVEVKPDTVVLKVDESSNTRMTFSRDAIQQIIDVDTTTVEEGPSDS